LGMEGRGREILEKSAADAKNTGLFGESSDGKNSEGEHGGGAGSSDIPEELSASGRDFRGKGESRASHVGPGESGLGEGGRGFHGFEVLRAESWIIPFGPHVMDAQGFS